MALIHEVSLSQIQQLLEAILLTGGCNCFEGQIAQTNQSARSHCKCHISKLKLPVCISLASQGVGRKFH